MSYIQCMDNNNPYELDKRLTPADPTNYCWLSEAEIESLGADPSLGARNRDRERAASVLLDDASDEICPDCLVREVAEHLAPVYWEDGFNWASEFHAAEYLVGDHIRHPFTNDLRELVLHCAALYWLDVATEAMDALQMRGMIDQ